MRQYRDSKGSLKYWVCLIMLISLQIIYAGWAVDNDRKSNIAEIEKSAAKQIQYLHGLLRDKLQSKEYDSANILLQRWGAHNNRVVAITLSSVNGFVLSHYQSELDPTYFMSLTNTIPYSYHSAVILYMVVDLESAHRSSVELGVTLGAIIFLFSLFLTITTWLYVRQRKLAADFRDSEAKYRALADEAPDLRYRSDNAGKLVYVSQSFYAMTGYSAEEAMGMSLAEFYVNPEERKLMLVGLYRDGSVNDFVVQLKRRDGSIRWTSVNTQLYKDQNGSVLGVDGVVRDVTESKLADDRLRANKALLDRSQEMAHIGSWRIDSRQERLFWSDEAYRIFGRLPQEFEPSYAAFLDATHPDDRDLVDSAYKVSLKEDQPYEITHRIIRPDGEVRTVQEKSDYVRDEHGAVIESHGIIHDITELMLAEEALRQRESELNSIFQTAPTGIGVTADRIFITVNDRFCEMVGYFREELVGENARMVYQSQEDYEEVGRKYFEQLTTLGTCTLETRLRHKDGTIINVILSMTPQDLKNLSASITFTFMDITAAKNTEKKLRQSELKFRAMMESMSDPVYICSDSFRVEYMNPAMIERTGRDAMGEFCYKALHDFDQQCPWCLGGSVGSGGVLNSDIESPKDGHSYNVSHSPITNEDGSISTMTIFRDVTELKRLEAQLLQAQKMEAIGTLAGGIAHDFNNILTSIIGYSEMVLLDLPGDSSSKNDVEQIIVSGKRATNLVRQILTFSRKEPKNLQVLNLFLVVKEVLKMLRSSLPTTVEIVENIDPECGEVLADQTQMHQVVMNLCTNAFQAMADQKGVVKVELRQLEIAPEEVSGWSREVAGSFVVLSISDTGCGMNAATRARIFEPYFTTKETGKGTGLGLAVIHGIIESCNGFIKVDSEPGQGTTFHVYMPSLEKDINLETLKTEKEVDLPTGSERIMVVDDEEAIIRLHETILQRLGYEVTSTIDSRVALAEIQSDPNAFDLLLTDQSMPNLSGAELAREVLKVKPTMPIILCTGYSSIVSEADALVLGIKRFAKKPVTLDELAHIVRQVLDENQETGEADECS